MKTLTNVTLIKATFFTLGLLLVGLFIHAPSAHAAFPGTNGRIVYFFDPSGEISDFDLFTMDPDGSDNRQITNNWYNETHPKYSPDGQKILAESRNIREMFIINQDGTNQSDFIPGVAGFDIDGNWYPLGDQIIFASNRDGNYDLFRMNQDGTNQQKIMSTPENEDTPVISPDGSKIAYSLDENSIWVMDANGNNKVRISPSPLAVGTNAPAWSPDGQWVIFGYNFNIWKARPDGSGQTHLVSGSNPSWAPDGSRIVFSSDPRGGQGIIYTMNPDGTGLYSTGRIGGAPDWQSIPNPNQTPSASAGGPYDVAERGFASLTGTATDPNPGDTLTYSWDLDNNGTFETSGQNVTFSAVGLDGPSSQTVALQVCDNHNACATSQASVIVTNVAPTVGTITAPTDPTALNTQISTSASFTDPGMPDTHTATWSWGDNTTSVGTITESNGSGSVSGSHTYTTAGVFTVSVTVTDNDGGSSTSSFSYLVIYDPAPQGFLTGSGKYNSLVGWYTQDPQAQGEAKFGFQAQYDGGATPTGDTKLNIKDLNLVFLSTSYQWLVVSGNKATLKGNGTINGTGNYTFIVSAIDGSPDLLRFQIKDSSNNIIYDTQPNAADTADPTTSPTSGSIKVH